MNEEDWGLKLFTVFEDVVAELHDVVGHLDGEVGPLDVIIGGLLDVVVILAAVAEVDVVVEHDEGHDAVEERKQLHLGHGDFLLQPDVGVGRDHALEVDVGVGEAEAEDDRRPDRVPVEEDRERPVQLVEYDLEVLVHLLYRRAPSLPA